VTIVMVGLSQWTAPVALRERLSKALEASACASGPASPSSLLLGAGFRESAVLSTCNRLEIYGVPDGAGADPRGTIVRRLTESAGVTAEELEPHLYYKVGVDAVEHLLRVACGLDSQVLGETQILGQVSQAFASARSGGTSGPLLTYLFTRASHAGKRARSETEISRGITSISHAAVVLLEKELGELAGKSILVAGAGETAELAVQALRKHGATQICCVNRTLSSAQDLALRYSCEARPWIELVAALADADAVLTATGSPHPVIYVDDVSPALTQRKGAPLVLVDIAVPRDVDLDVGKLPGVVLHDIDRLEATLDQNLSRRYDAVPGVEEIVARETRRVMEWLHGREAADLVVELREHAKTVAGTELGSALRKLDGLDDDEREVISRMANRIVSKLLHQPTRQLKSRAVDDDFDTYCEAVVDLFGLRCDRPAKPAGVTAESGGG
jgi:glutamyl-tRNA reductase